MGGDKDIRPPADTADGQDRRSGLTDATPDVGDTSDLEDSARLEEERTRRMTGEQPDLPDRAFDRITPQV